jgi:hypothetical protein
MGRGGTLGAASTEPAPARMREIRVTVSMTAACKRSLSIRSTMVARGCRQLSQLPSRSEKTACTNCARRAIWSEICWVGLRDVPFRVFLPHMRSMVGRLNLRQTPAVPAWVWCQHVFARQPRGPEVPLFPSGSLLLRIQPHRLAEGWSSDERVAFGSPPGTRSRAAHSSNLGASGHPSQPVEFANGISAFNEPRLSNEQQLWARSRLTPGNLSRRRGRRRSDGGSVRASSSARRRRARATS